MDEGGGRESPAAAATGPVCPTSLLIGFFDPIDGRAIAEAARLSVGGPVRAVVLGDGFGRFDDLLSCAEDRCEIVSCVRGVSSVVLVRDRRALAALLRRTEPDTIVQWLDRPVAPRADADARHSAQRAPLPNTV